MGHAGLKDPLPLTPSRGYDLYEWMKVPGYQAGCQVCSELLLVWLPFVYGIGWLSRLHVIIRNTAESGTDIIMTMMMMVMMMMMMMMTMMMTMTMTKCLERLKRGGVEIHDRRLLCTDTAARPGARHTQTKPLRCLEIGSRSLRLSSDIVAPVTLATECAKFW